MEHLSHLAHMVEDNWCAAWASLARVDAMPRTIVDQSPGCLRVYTPGVPETLLNMVIRFTQPGPVTARDIERVLAPYRELHLPPQWWLLLGADPPGLRAQLSAVGMQSWGGATAMALDLAAWQPHEPPALADLTQGKALRRADASDALDVICRVFYVAAEPMARWTIQNPAVQVYLARTGPHAVCALATLQEEDVVGVYHVATVPGARRRGIAGNLLNLALREAQTAGCRVATLTATPEARHLYETLGFRAVGSIEQWMPGPQLMADLLHGWRSPAQRWQ